MGTTILPARTVLTVDPEQPRTEALAIDNGRIVGTGSAADLRARFSDASVDDRYRDAVLAPGFVEAHSHATEGALWAWEYVGYFSRLGPDGVRRDGCQSIDDVLDQLRRLDAELTAAGAAVDESLIVWGFDPIYLPGERLAARHLDAVSSTRPIAVIHASLHLTTVNTVILEREGIVYGSPVEGVPVDADGRAFGELQEPPAMSLARRELSAVFGSLSDPASLERLGDMARLVGCTTVTELGASRLDDAGVQRWHSVVDRPEFPSRVVVLYNPNMESAAPDDAVARVRELAARSTDKLRMGMVKIISDGSIQGYTARLNPPGYLPRADGTERPNGMWLIEPERFFDLFDAFHRAGITVHTHVNGDQAVDMLLDVAGRAIDGHRWDDHRHTAQHSQLTTAEQYQQLAELGMNANLFSNHIFYWGDQHRDLTVGPGRAALLDACAMADAAGVRYSIHSDASVTPLGSLHTMWCAVNRVTATGEVLGAEQRIDAERALRAVTIDAAHQLRLDDEIGSLEVGKRADLVALADDPTTVDPMAIRDIEVLGTMLDGVPTA